MPNPAWTVIAAWVRTQSSPAGLWTLALAGLALTPACSSSETPAVQETGGDRTLQTDTVQDTQTNDTVPMDVVTTGTIGNSATVTGDSASTFAELGDMTEGEGISEETACSGLEAEAEQVVTEVEREVITEEIIEVEKPVAIYILLDNSTSMNQSGSVNGDNNGPGNDGMDMAAGGAGGAASVAATAASVAGPTTKWESAVQAITDFVNDPGSNGIEVAIQYFHPPNTNDAEECDGSGHSTPAVAMAALPGNAAPVVASLESTGQSTSTPTVGALTGGVEFCRNFEVENPDKTCVTVLVTDGSPNGCGVGGRDNEAGAVLTPIAAQGLTDGITTFTVGMAGVSEEDFSLLDAIAVAGGSDCTPDTAGDEACDVSTSGAAGFLAALNTIRETVSVTETTTMIVTDTVVEDVVLPCEFMVPPPTTGEPIDENKVIVNLNINGGEQEKLPKATDAGSCAGDGWYFADPSNLTLISTCPATCARIEAATSANVDVLLGCEDILQ